MGLSVKAQTLEGYIRNFNTKEAIPYATVQLGPDYGTIANEEGGFSLSLAGKAGDSLLISSMGYAQKRIPLPSAMEEIVIYLEPSAIELDEVLLRDRQPSAEEIIREVRRAYPQNYSSTDQKYEVFYRGTSYMQFEDLNVDIDKATRIPKQQVARASKKLDSLARSVVESKLMEFRDYSGIVLLKQRDSSKISIDRATRLLDSRKEFSMEGVQKQAQGIILQYLDTSKTYKLKTGLFKIEDSLALDKEEFRQEKKTEYSRGEIRSSVMSTLKRSQWHENSFLEKLLDPKAYEYTLDGISYFQGNPIYVVSFFPGKGSSRFAGTFYISTRDYAVLKADYAFGDGKRGRKFNMKLLLGIKYIEKTHKGTVIYKAGANGIYHPYYITKEEGNYIYLHRPLKFIENSPRKDKVLFDFNLEGEGREKRELLILKAEDLDPAEFINLTEAEKIPYTELKQFESSIWQDRQIIQPLEEMKNFKAGD
ncbi:hypothetical protein GCM10011361_01750 [Muriicola marianensis]|uniref:Carboxypeptidase-like regulatory domain-containing protein n=2 Tax=Muriicola marianensis TaxID=1324801 RepID=A0ABQ1QPT4_9FLAO|nr:hypothetical protein GCM10011361_01750 [Muriicola marianensis]